MALRAELEWQLEDYLRVLWLHRWLVFLVTVTSGGLMAIYMFQQPNLYEASARILIEAQPPKVVQFQEVAPTYAGAWSQSFLQTEYKVISSRAVVSRVMDELHLAAFPPFSQAKDPVGELQKVIAVEPVRGTKLVDIRVDGEKPDLIAQMANTVADTYAALNLERRREMTTGGVQWLKEEVAKLEEKMHTAQLALQKFLEDHGSIDFGQEQQNTILQRLQALNAAITETRKDRIEAEQKFREKHPHLLELQAKEQELQLAIFDQEQKTLEMSRLSIQYNTLLREVKTNEEIYNVLLTRQKELSVQEGLQTNNVQVVDYALVPEEPIGPARASGIAIATFLGLILSYGLGFLREMLAKTLRSRRDFEQLLEIPFLGHVPLIQMGGVHRGNESLVLLTEPQSTAAEAIRAIRTTLEFLLPIGQPHTLLITSALPEEGKSLVCLNLAIALQELGRKVLLVDGDLRRPSLHRLLQVDLEPGLSEYLQDKAAVEMLVRSAAVAHNLFVVPAGLTPEQPTDLLGSPRLQTLLETWKQAYQYILIDTPPALVAADAAVLATIIEQTIFLVRAGRTPGEASLAGKQRLVDVGAKILGGILNGARLELEGGYRYYHYYRYYRARDQHTRKGTRQAE